MTETALRCERAECTKDAHVFVLPDDITEFTLCDTHAAECGFCYLCGSFQGGIESFDFRNPAEGYAGLCDDCVFQLKDSCGELDEDEDEYESDDDD